MSAEASGPMSLLQMILDRARQQRTLPELGMVIGYVLLMGSSNFPTVLGEIPHPGAWSG
jgi:hypothetical protein